MGTTTDLINGAQIVAVIASSTTGYLSNFSPVILLGGGLLLAFFVGLWLIDIIGSVGSPRVPDFDFAKADELQRFYGSAGRKNLPRSHYFDGMDGIDFDDTIET